MTNLNSFIDLITLIRACYGRFNSFRTAKLGMQELKKLFQFTSNKRLSVINSSLYIDSFVY